MRDDDLNAVIGKRIKEARVARKITQETFAEKIGVCNGQHVSNIERGYSGLSVSKLVKVCETLDVTADWLLFGASSALAHTETELHDALASLTREQRAYLTEIIRMYLKACGVKQEE